MKARTLIEFVSVILLAVGAYFCIFVSPSMDTKDKDSDSYIPTNNSTTTTTTTKPVFKGIDYKVLFTGVNEDIHLLNEDTKNSVRLTTDDLENTSWEITRVNNVQGNQCYLYSQDDENAFIVTLVDGCNVTRPALVTAKLNNETKQIKVYIGD